MRIQYVVSTMVFWWRENRLTFEQDCQFLKSQGYGVELWPTIYGEHECRYKRRNWSRLASATEGMVVSMRSRTDEPNLDKWKEQIECAKLLGANIVTGLHNLGIRGDAETNGEGFTADVVSFAEENDVRLCLETGSLPAVKQAGERFDSLWYCLDVGHANIDPVYNFKQYVDELCERVGYLHLSDNYGIKDEHETPGLRGGISRENWEYLIERLSSYDNEIIASLEMRPCTPAVMIRQASEFIFDELGWPNQPQKQHDLAEIQREDT